MVESKHVTLSSAMVKQKNKFKIKLAEPNSERLEQVNWMIMEMLEAAYNSLYFAADAVEGMDQTDTALFIAETNLIYQNLQEHFSKSNLNVHREIIARELTSQLGDRYPAFIRPLTEGFNEEADHAI